MYNESLTRNMSLQYFAYPLWHKSNFILTFTAFDHGNRWCCIKVNPQVFIAPGGTESLVKLTTKDLVVVEHVCLYSVILTSSLHCQYKTPESNQISDTKLYRHHVAQLH
jgi:hypothetical protein